MSSPGVRYYAYQSNGLDTEIYTDNIDTAYYYVSSYGYYMMRAESYGFQSYTITTRYYNNNTEISPSLTQSITGTYFKIHRSMIGPNGFTQYTGDWNGIPCGLQTTYYNETFNLRNYSLTGYNTLKWNTNSALTGTDYNMSGSYKTNTSDNNFYLKKTPITYTIQYYDGATEYTGATALSPASINYDVVYNSPTPAKTGYTFNGWYTEYALSTPARTAQAWTYTTNQIFYAKFTANSYTLIYNLDGGTITNNPTTVTYDASYDLKIPTKTNYTFNGWYSDSNKTTSISTSGTTWKLTSVNNIYAKFTINGYDLTYNTNNIGGAGKTYNTVIVGTTLTTLTSPPIHIPKAFGYTFNGWYDSQSGGNKKINSDGTGVSGSYTMPAAATTLYAQWTVKSDVRLSYLDATFGNIAGNSKISISEYQNSILKTASTRTALKADFIGKGPNL